MKQASKKVNKSKPGIGLFLTLAIAALVITNVLTFYILRTKAMPSADSCGKNYPFINPRFACGEKSIINKKGYVEFEDKLQEFIEEKKKEGKIDSIGVWFRDLEFGPTFGINQFEDFIPASLLKLPLAITLMQLAEDDPGILEKTIVYPNNLIETPNQTFMPSIPMEVGKSYTINELIARTVSYSDNHAAQMLYEYLLKNYSDNPLSKTYRDLGIIEPGTDLNKAGVNAKDYGSIFRLLYNVSFLEKDSSEKILTLLEHSDFEKGLRAGVPHSTGSGQAVNVRIADKFGERYLDNGKKQLHDCGIIYYPGNPYQLCIMTMGNNFEDLESVISQISKMTYEEFDSRRL